MTRQRSFKRLVRAQMDKTGESYTAARAVLLAADEPKAAAKGGTAARASLLAADEPKAAAKPVLVTSDESIRARTGRGWEEWFDLLDDWGAPEWSHREIARRVAAELGIEALGWSAQAVAVSYERARGLRVVGQRADGFTATASKTVAVPVDRLYQAFVDESLRRRWLPDGELHERTATAPRSARFDWGDGSSRVHVSFEAKGDDRSVAVVEHQRLADGDEGERMKAYWRARVAALKEELER